MPGEARLGVQVQRRDLPVRVAAAEREELHDALPRIGLHLAPDILGPVAVSAPGAMLRYGPEQVEMQVEQGVGRRSARTVDLLGAVPGVIRARPHRRLQHVQTGPKLGIERVADRIFCCHASMVGHDRGTINHDPHGRRQRQPADQP